MMLASTAIGTYAGTVIMPILVIALVLAMVRLLRGPSVADRVVALDLVTTIAIALVATGALWAGSVVMLDVAVIVALVAFLGTVALAYYIRRQTGH